MQIGYLTCKDVAKMTGVSIATVWSWVRSGRLKASRPGGRDYFIKQEDFEMFIESDNRNKPVAPA